MMLNNPISQNLSDLIDDDGIFPNPSFDGFKTITLNELEEMKLLARFDSKFVFHRTKLDSLLKDLAVDYHVLKIQDQTIFHYESVYLDTDDFKLYLMHHNGKPERIKVRWRRYTDIQKVFFEVKRKTPKKKTEKVRLEEPAILEKLTPAQSQLLDSLGYKDLSLKPMITISYDRITMVSKSENIKVTLDLNIKFENMAETKMIPWLVVAEIKSRRITPKCIFMESIKKHGIRQASFSKYAAATASLQSVKHNAFKPELLLITKLKNERA